MCGIYFSIGYEPDPARRRWRGPESQGWRVFTTRRGPVPGHRRLSIIDLNDRAAQPFKAADGDELDP